MGLKQAYFALRDQVRFAWAQRQYNYEPQGSVENFDWAKIKHIVILKLDGKLGDTQVMSHFYHNLKNLAHKPTLTVVCPENLAAIYDDILGFDQVLISSRKPKTPEIQNLCQQIIGASQAAGNNGKVDLVLSTEPNYRPRDFIFNYFLKPDFIVGCAPKVESINLFLYHPDSYNHPVSKAFCDLMEKGHLSYSKPVAYVPFYTKESLHNALAYLRPHASLASPALQESFFTVNSGANSSNNTNVTEQEGSEQNIIACSKRFDDSDFIFGLNSLGASKSRCMNVATSVALCNEILKSASNTKVLLMCHSSFKDYIKEVISLIEPSLLMDKNGKTRVIVLPENTSVLDLGALVHCLDALITVDTATVHMACASLVPELCFYKNDTSNACRWAPIGHQAICVKFVDANFQTKSSDAFTLVASYFIKEQLEKALQIIGSFYAHKYG